MGLDVGNFYKGSELPDGGGGGGAIGWRVISQKPGISQPAYRPGGKIETVTQTLFLGGILLPDLGWKRKK